jgi:bifunctional aromatase (cyclase/dehydratase)
MTLVEDRDAIRDLFARYAILMDEGAADEWAATYTDDGVFEHVGGETVRGQDALRAMAASQPPGIHHVLTNHAIDVSGDTAVSVASVIVVYHGAIVTSGRARDELLRVGGGWRIRHRVYTPDVASAPSA